MQTTLSVDGDLGKYKIVISDIIGKRIAVIEFEGVSHSIDCSAYFAGVYLVSVLKGDCPLATTKLMISK